MWLKCWRTSRRLRARLDEGGGLDEHIMGCARCARELDELKRLRGYLKKMPVYPAPEGFSVRVMRQVRAGRLEKEAPPGRRTLAYLAEAMAIALVVAAGIVSGNYLASSISGDSAGYGAPASENQGSQTALYASAEYNYYVSPADQTEDY